MILLARLLFVLALVFSGPASATVTSSQNTVTIAGNGSQTAFPFGFIGVSTSDISVLFTSSTGQQTTVTQGPGSTQFQVTLNAAVPGAIWGIGGTVTYNPGGTPIPAGSTLTIVRTVPNEQLVSLQNQASFGQYAVSAEQMGDLLAMQNQQTSNQSTRALVANVANSAPPNPLPPAAQAAGQGLCFDGTGNNVVACSLAPSGAISSAMAPVVDAATIPSARTLLGLGTMAEENINSGTCGGTTIQDDGSGNARVVFQTVQDATNQTVTCAFHGTQRAATGSLVYTLPKASTLFNGFGFWVYALTGNVTFSPNASDNFPGQAGGASYVIPAGSAVYVATNAAASGAWYPTTTDPMTLRATPSLSAPYNLSLGCSVAGNALTCNVLDRNGNTPSAASPVIASFRNPTAATGTPVLRTISGALSLTIPSGATIGTANGQANRLWLAWADIAGTPALCVWNSLNVSGPSIVAWDETSPTTAPAISGSSSSAQTWYCSSAAVTSVSFRVLGYVESTQSTAGTWASAPTKIQLFGPGVRKPGETVQEVSQFNTQSLAGTSVSNFTVAPGCTITMSVQSAADLVRVDSDSSWLLNNSVNALVSYAISRGVTNNTGILAPRTQLSNTNSGLGATANLFAYDLGVIGSTSWALQYNGTSATLNLIANSIMSAREIQG